MRVLPRNFCALATARNLVFTILFIFLAIVATAPVVHAQEALPQSADQPVPVAVVNQSPASDIGANWLNAKGELSKSHLLRLVDIAQRDSETAAILKNAQEVLGASNVDQLMRLVGICDDDELGENMVGLTKLKPYRRFTGRRLSEITGKESVDHKSKFIDLLKGNQKFLRLAVKQDYVIGEYYERDSICIVARSDLAHTFKTFIHELIHISKMMPKTDPEDFLAQYKNSDDYIEKVLMEPGGEFEANYEGYRNLIRLKHSREGMSKNLAESFNDSGDLVDQKKFREFLLDDVGYGERLRRNYENSLVSFYSSLVTQENFLIRIHNSRASATMPGFLPDTRKAARDSIERIKKEREHLANLRKTYESRFAVEGMAVTPAGE